MVWRWLKQWRKKKQDKQDYNLTCCYDKDGVKLYKFDNPLKLPTVRRLMLFQSINDAALGVGKDDLKKFFEICDEYANAAQYGKLIQAVGILKFYTDQHSNTQSIYSTASCLIMMEGEKPEEVTPEIMQKKKQLFDTNPDVRSFFLQMGYAYLMSFSAKSSLRLNIVDYLQTAAVSGAEGAFLKLITRNTEAGMKKTQTSKSIHSQKEQAKQLKN